MTDINFTKIVAVLDRSGSMIGLKADTIGGFNSFVDKQKETPGRATLTLVQFDHHYQVDYENIDINDVQHLNEKTYEPRGGTALLDAVGWTVNTVGQSLSQMKEEERPGQVIFLIITDGFENSSKEFEPQQVKDMVQHQIEKYNWSFVYLGGGDLEMQKNQGLSLGIIAANVMNYNVSPAGTAAVYSSVGSAVTRTRCLASSGQRISSSYSLLTSEEKDSLNKS